MDLIGSYQKRPFLKTRIANLDTLRHGRQKYHIPGLLEVDVTRSRQRIREIKDRTGEGLSFTGWVTKCVAQAVSEHRQVHGLRKGRRTIILFDDVDVTVVVEREAPGVDTAETLPMPYVVRKANEKSVREIHQELRAAQSQLLEVGKADLATGPSGRLTGLFFSLPRVVRDLLLWRRLAKNPFFAKKTMGTVMITAIGMFARGSGSMWGIPIGIHPLIIALGGIVKKPAVVGDEILVREFLSVTLLFDHVVVDGAPIARFIDRLLELLETGFGLEEAC